MGPIQRAGELVCAVRSGQNYVQNICTYVIKLLVQLMSTSVDIYIVLGRTKDVHVLMGDEKEQRKKQARSKKQQGKATQHTQGSLTFPKKNELPRVSNPRHSTL